MPSVSSTTPIACTGGPLSAIDGDLLIVPWFEDDAPGVAGVDAASGGEVARALSSKEFQAKPYEMFLTPMSDRSWRTSRMSW